MPKYTITATTPDTVNGQAGVWQHVEITFEDEHVESQKYFVPNGTNVADFLKAAVLEVTDTGDGGTQKARKRVTSVIEGVSRQEVTLTRPSR